MRYNFKRAYSLTIGTAPTIVESTIPEYLDPVQVPWSLLRNKGEALVLLNIPAKAIEINTLQMKTSITVSTEDKGQSGQTTIEVLNLDPDTLQFITRKNSLIVLKAGYDYEADNLPIIFSGQVKDVSSRRSGGDLVTTITASDGYTPSTGVKISTSLIARPPLINLNYEDVFNHLIRIWADNGVTISKRNILLDNTLPLRVAPKDILIPDGWSYEGYLRDAMDDLCEHFNYTHYLQNNILFIHPINLPNFTNVFVLGEDQIQDIHSSVVSDNSSTDEEKLGHTMTLFLNGKIKMGNRIRVAEGNFKGDYLVSSIKHMLDFRGQSWATEITTEIVK
jgi:hypothetical protein